MVRARRQPSPGDGDEGGGRFATGRSALGYRKPANDNRLGLKGWLKRLGALVVLIGLAALLAWKVGG